MHGGHQRDAGAHTEHSSLTAIQFVLLNGRFYWQALLQKQARVKELTGKVSNTDKVQEFTVVANYLPDIDLFHSLSCQLSPFQQTVS